MSAIQIPRMEHETAHILDDFWHRLEPEEKAALITAFEIGWKRNVHVGRMSGGFCLKYAKSGREGVVNLERCFRTFLVSRIQKCRTAAQLMQEIIEWSKLSEDEQEATREIT